MGLRSSPSTVQPCLNSTIDTGRPLHSANFFLGVRDGFPGQLPLFPLYARPLLFAQSSVGIQVCCIGEFPQSAGVTVHPRTCQATQISQLGPLHLFLASLTYDICPYHQYFGSCTCPPMSIARSTKFPADITESTTELEFHRNHGSLVWSYRTITSKRCPGEVLFVIHEACLDFFRG